MSNRTHLIQNLSEAFGSLGRLVDGLTDEQWTVQYDTEQDDPGVREVAAVQVLVGERTPRASDPSRSRRAR